jgi:signal transduction histidine kinase
MRSLQSRLGLSLSISLLALLALQGFLQSQALRHTAESVMETRLTHDAEALLGAIEFNAEGGVQFAYDHIGPIYHRPFSGHYYVVRIGGREFHSRSLWDESLALPAALPVEGLRMEAIGPQSQRLLVIAREYHKQNQRISIAIAEDLTPVDADVRNFQRRYAVIAAAVLIVLLLVQMLLVRHGLKPLTRLRREIAELERGERQSLDERAPAEVAPLVGELNRLLHTLQQRLHRSRNSLGNLAHALKAPLTLIHQQAERPELDDHPEVRKELLARTGIIHDLIERELKRARVAGSAAPGRKLDLETETADLIVSLKAIYRGKNLAFRIDLPKGTTCPMDREDLMELLGNLLDNACKWARATVALTVKHNDIWVFRVEDDGPGAPLDQLERLTQRGARLDEQTEGHGLGLAIVHDIVASYGGGIRFSRSAALNGFCAEITLPLSTHAAK